MQQAGRCESLEAGRGEAGVRPGDAARLTICLTQIASFAEGNEVYAESSLSLIRRDDVEAACVPKGAAAEIDVIVSVSRRRSSRRSLEPAPIPWEGRPVSRGIVR